jgi:predicted esterase
MSGPNEELAQFTRAASERSGASTRRLVVVGHSNGANLAGSLILLHPHYIAGAVLFRVMVHCCLIHSMETVSLIRAMSICRHESSD